MKPFNSYTYTHTYTHIVAAFLEKNQCVLRQHKTNKKTLVFTSTCEKGVNVQAQIRLYLISEYLANIGQFFLQWNCPIHYHQTLSRLVHNHCETIISRVLSSGQCHPVANFQPSAITSLRSLRTRKFQLPEPGHITGHASCGS